MIPAQNHEESLVQVQIHTEDDSNKNPDCDMLKGGSLTLSERLDILSKYDSEGASNIRDFAPVQNYIEPQVQVQIQSGEFPSKPPDRKVLKRKTLTLSEKLELLSKYDSEGSTNIRDFARSVNIPESSLRTLLRNREEIEKNAAIVSVKRKKIKAGKHEEIEKILLEWLTQAWSLNMRVNGPVIKEKASEIAQLLETEFSPSSGWLDRFKKRHGIVYNQSRPEATDLGNEYDVDYWISNSLLQITENYASCDIYNVDELGLLYKVMPDRCMLFNGEKCHGGKYSEERVTVFLGSNSDGSDKLRPLVVGRPRPATCFENVGSLPCDYINQNRALMTADIFINWLRDFDLKMGKQSRKIVLVLDDCPAHPKDVPGLKNIRLEFVPSNSTKVLQPMVQGVVQGFRKNYRKRLIQRFLSDMEHPGKATAVNLLEAVHYIRAAWDDVERSSIVNCFRNAGIRTSVEPEIPDGLSGCLDGDDLVELRQRLGHKWASLDAYINVDQDVITSEVRSIENIIDDVIGEEDLNDDDATEPPTVPTVSSVMEAFSVVRRYASCLDVASSEEILRHVNAAEKVVMRHRPAM